MLYPYFWISTQIWMRKLLSRWRRIPPLRRCCAPWSNRRRWSKRKRNGGIGVGSKQLGTAAGGRGRGWILEPWICCFSWKLGGISLKDGILMEVFKPEHLEASSKNDGLLLCFFGFEFLGIFSYLSILLMEEFLHQLIGSLFHYWAWYIPGG